MSVSTEWVHRHHNALKDAVLTSQGKAYGKLYHSGPLAFRYQLLEELGAWADCHTVDDVTRICRVFEFNKTEAIHQLDVKDSSGAIILRKVLFNSLSGRCRQGLGVSDAARQVCKK